jgi:cytochrome c-type protein NapB
MQRNGQSIVVLAGVLMLLGCATQEPGGAEPTLADEELGLSKTSVFDVADPIVATSSAGDPGENPHAEPYFSGAPPVIPHRIEDFLPIRLDENLCRDCHDAPDRIGEPVDQYEPTPAPLSHYTDLRRSPGETGKQLVGARYVCVQCHVPQTDAEPLVASTFRP